MGVSNITLHDYYQLNFGFMQYHKYSLTEINDMIPYERDLYAKLILDHLEAKQTEEKNG